MMGCGFRVECVGINMLVNGFRIVAVIEDVNGGVWKFFSAAFHFDGGIDNKILEDCKADYIVIQHCDYVDTLGVKAIVLSS